MAFTVACAQFAPEKAEVDRNLDTIAEIVVQAHAEGADLLVLPETATSGYFLEGGVLESSLTKAELVDALWNRLRGKLKRPIDVSLGFYLNDDGKEIRADVQFAWSNFGTASTKQFKLVYPHIISDGSPTLYVDIKTDYDITAPANMPDVAIVSVGSDWDTATWNVDQWAGQAAPSGSWQGVTGLGRVAAPRFRVAVKNCTFALSAADVVYEEGSPL